jgi:hypothetical protein
MSEENIFTSFDPGQCPLCRRSNDCQLCTSAAYKGPCWCARANISSALLDQVPPDLKNKACICRACIFAFERETLKAQGRKILPGDFYFEAGLMVFTAAYHLRRGFCCESGCRNCPYGEAKSHDAPSTCFKS